MADWYVSSAAYAGYTAFVASHAYSVGNIVVPTAPALKAKWVFRCTTAGTSSTEPTWPTGNSATITTGGATFTNVTGQSTYFWAAAAGDIPTLIGAVGTFRFAGGDRLFVSSDHSETQTTATTYGSGTGTGSYSSSQVLSVNRAGSVPPVAADLTAGATCTSSGSSITIDAQFPVYHYGMNYVCSGAVGIALNSAAGKTNYFDVCQLYLSGAGSSAAKLLNSGSATLILNNSTLRFANASQTIACSTGSMEIVWMNTPSALAGATFPTILLGSNSTTFMLLATCRGIDLSALTGTLVTNANSGAKYLFDSCRIASGVTRYNVSGTSNTRDVVELVNCFDGTNIISERYAPAGTLTTERTITLVGGAQDDIGLFSHKLVSTANIDKYANPFESFWLDVENATVGGSRTATVEIVSSAALNNDEISLLLEYQGTSGSSLASFVNTMPATPLTAAAAVTTSTATWNSPPTTPAYQKLQVTFTPWTAGRVRGLVRLGKASTTVYVNPQVTVV